MTAEIKEIDSYNQEQILMAYRKNKIPVSHPAKEIVFSDSGASVPDTLKALEKQGLIVFSTKDGTKYFTITEKGLDRGEELREERRTELRHVLIMNAVPEPKETIISFRRETPQYILIFLSDLKNKYIPAFAIYALEGYRTQASMEKCLSDLEAEGLIERQTSGQPGAPADVRLTEAGKEKALLIWKDWKKQAEITTLNMRKILSTKPDKIMIGNIVDGSPVDFKQALPNTTRMTIER